MKTPLSSPDLSALFAPESVAHVGASAVEQVGRFNFTQFLTDMKFEGKIIPVNPKYEEVLGNACYPSLAAVPDDIDLTILALPARQCVEILRDVPSGKLKFVVVHTSGFGEIDNNDLEEEILDMGHKKGFRVIGPNCMGIYCQEGRIGFWEDHHRIVDTPGSVGLVSQSGGIGINVISRGKNVGLKFNKAVSLGNQIDLSVNEVLEYMGEDDSIKVIALYVEDILDGRRFLELLQRITPNKPVLVWKGGVTEVGRAAAMSHTGSLAGDSKVFFSAMRQAGAIIVDDFIQMVRAIRILQPPFPLPGERVAVVCPGGGNTVNIADVFSDLPDLTMPMLSEETRATLQAMLPVENIDLKNPIDPGATGYTQMDKLINIIGDDPGLDFVVTMVAVDFLDHFEGEDTRATVVDMLSEIFRNIARDMDKPHFIHLMQIEDNNEDFYHYRHMMIEAFEKKQIPWLDGSFKDAAVVFSRIAGYCRYLKCLK